MLQGFLFIKGNFSEDFSDRDSLIHLPTFGSVEKGIFCRFFFSSDPIISQRLHCCYMYCK